MVSREKRALLLALVLGPALWWVGLPACLAEGVPLKFVTARSFPVGSGDWTYVRAIASADLDGDGRVDIVTASGRPNEVSILPGRSGRTFRAAVNIPVEFLIGYWMVPADFDGDGDIDLVVQDRVTTEQRRETRCIVLLENEGDFRFSERSRYVVPGEGWEFQPADIDADGRLDVLVPVFNSSEFEVLLGHGDGTFEEAFPIEVPGMTRLRRVVAGDLDGDGLEDLVVTGAADTWLVGVMRNLGSGAFAAPDLYEAGPIPVTVRIADIDRDGDGDIVAASLDSVGIGLLYNDGAGRFGGLRMLGGVYSPGRVELGDVNGDGWLDICATGGAFYLGTGRTVCGAGDVRRWRGGRGPHGGGLRWRRALGRRHGAVPLRRA